MTRISMARARQTSTRAALLAGAAILSAAATQASAQAVEEVVVTAQRREEKLQDVPAAISAFTGGQLERLGIDSSRELTQITPGLNFTQSVYSPQPTIRGIGVRGVGAGDESQVPIYIDGVYQAFLQGAILQFNNVERIEVLKGPQGALFGRNATGGAINIITKKPKAGFTGDLSASYGRFSEWAVKGYVAAGSDTMGMDLAVVADGSDGYIKDDLRKDKYGDYENFTARSKILFRPNDQVELTVAGSWTNNVDSLGVAYNSFGGNTNGKRLAGNLVTSQNYRSHLNFHPYYKVNQANVSLTAVLKFTGFDVTALTGYQNSVMKNKTDSDATPFELNTTISRQYSRNTYNEIYATSNGEGAFSWILGTVYFHDTSGNSPYATTYSRAVSVTGVLAATTTITRFSPKLGTDSYAYYAQGTYQFSPEWSLTLGGRYTREKKTFNTTVGVTTFTTLSSNDTFKKFTPVGILKYQPRDDLNFYAKAGKAFKSGIINSSATTVLALKAVNPENLTQYEVGMKSDLSSSVRLNVAAYYTDYKDLQSTARDPATSTSLLQNAGGAEIYGVEAEAYWRPMDNLNIRLGISALHGEYTDFPGAQVIIPVTSIDPIATANQCVLGTGVLVGGNRAPFCDATGNKIIRTPFFTASLGGDYTIPLDSGEVVISGNIYHQGKSYWDVGNRVVEPKKLLVNAQVAWKSASDKYGVTLWGENLTNETHRLTASISQFGDNQVIAKPRTYGIELTYGW